MNSGEFQQNNSGIEIKAEDALENTALVFSVPVMGEWYNGQASKMLLAFFSQHNVDPFEVNLVVNSGNNPDKSSENAELIKFLDLIIQVQRLARVNETSQESTPTIFYSNLFAGIHDPILLRILKLAYQKADVISLSYINANSIDLADTPYNVANPSMALWRTIGADFAYCRFSQNTVFHMFDADTIPSSNNYAQLLIDSYSYQKYQFSNMGDSLAGISLNFLESTAFETTRKAIPYNLGFFRGSPQISFRLSEYKRIREIGSYPELSNYEDFDTFTRLMFVFNKPNRTFIQHVLTADRLDGSFDSMQRKQNFESGKYSITGLRSLASVIRDMSNDILKNLGSSSEAKGVLEGARKFYIQRQKVYSRFLKQQIKLFTNAVKEKDIFLEDGDIKATENFTIKYQNPYALIQYIKDNKSLVMDILEYPSFLGQIQDFLNGEHKTYTDDDTALRFDQILSDHLGETVHINTLDSNQSADISLYHTIMAEIFAISSLTSQLSARTIPTIDVTPNFPDLEERLRWMRGISGEF